MTAARVVSAGELVRVVSDLPDPELPFVTIGDLGIVRTVRVSQEGTVHIDITPTYTGCPAIEAITEAIVEAVIVAGHPEVEVRTVLSPAWSTDWISEAGRRKLHAAGIAPPGPVTGSAVTLALPPRCPRCDSGLTRSLGFFGSTACKARYLCTTCQEPFEHMKPI